MDITKKERQRQRMMSYFIDAAHQIIETEGIEALNIRKVADMAGYNSATIYNYFNNLEHLISYAAIKYLKDYYITLDSYIKSAKNSFERFLLIWEKFSTYSYKNPEIFRIIFFSGQSIADIYFDYFKIFPSDFGEHAPLILSMVSEHNLFDRNKKILEPLVEDAFIRYEDIDEVNYSIIALYRGSLELILDRKYHEQIDLDKEVKSTVTSIERILKTYYIP